MTRSELKIIGLACLAVSVGASLGYIVLPVSVFRGLIVCCGVLVFSAVGFSFAYGIGLRDGADIADKIRDGRKL